MFVASCLPCSCASAAVLVLAFFAFRPRKGWLRKKAPVADVDNSAKLDSVGIDTFITPKSEPRAPAAPPAKSPMRTGLDMLINHSSYASTPNQSTTPKGPGLLPLSYITSVGVGAGASKSVRCKRMQ